MFAGNNHKMFALLAVVVTVTVIVIVSVLVLLLFTGSPLQSKQYAYTICTQKVNLS